MRRVLAGVALCGLALAGCGGGSDFAASRRALERAGYRKVSITVRSGGGVVVARVTGSPPAAGASPDDAAETLWHTLPVRFDQLVLATVPAVPVYSYVELRARFGPRDASLDRRPPSEGSGRTRSELLALVVLGAALAGAGLVAGTLLIRRSLRLGRRQLDQAEGPGSALGAGAPSPMAEGSAEAAEAGEIPS